MKIYKVIYSSIYLDEGENITTATIFLDKDLAIKYLKDRIKTLKDQMKELDSEDYCVNEDDTSYERYLDGRAIEDSVSIWLVEDETYDEKMLQEINKSQNEQDKDYEM